VVGLSLTGSTCMIHTGPPMQDRPLAEGLTANPQPGLSSRTLEVFQPMGSSSTPPFPPGLAGLLPRSRFPGLALRFARVVRHRGSLAVAEPEGVLHPPGCQVGPRQQA